jgi:hypothetical protein
MLGTDGVPVGLFAPNPEKGLPKPVCDHTAEEDAQRMVKPEHAATMRFIFRPFIVRVIF